MIGISSVLLPKRKSKTPRKLENSKRNSIHPNKKKKKKPNFDLNFATEKIPQYNSLLDKHLSNYFSNPNVEFMLAFEGQPKKPVPLKRHTYANILTKDKKKKHKKELKKVIDFIESQNDKIRPKPPENAHLSQNEQKQRKIKQIIDEGMIKSFQNVPPGIRGRILSYLDMKEALRLVQVLGCQYSSETWKLFLMTYFKLQIFPYVSSQFTEIHEGKSRINYYKLFKQAYYDRKQYRNKLFTGIRIRPFIVKEYERCFTKFLDEQEGKPKVIVHHPVGGKKHGFSGFDHLFWSHSARVTYASQEKVFESVAPILLNVLCRGTNVTIFACGPPKSGKTFQIFGSDSQPGLLPRFSEAIYSAINRNTNPELVVNIQVSMVEFSEGNFIDMFDTSGQTLEVIHDPIHGSYLEALTILPVPSWEDMSKIIHIQRNEVKASIDPTRRATIFQMNLIQTLFKENDPKNNIISEKNSTLTFVDLPASSQNDMPEDAEVNHTLSSLREVLLSLHLKKKQKSNKKRKKGSKSQNFSKVKVPYKLSNLTCILEGALKQSSKILVLGCITPCQYEETIQVLEYVSSLKGDKAVSIQEEIINQEPPMNAKPRPTPTSLLPMNSQPYASQVQRTNLPRVSHLSNMQTKESHNNSVHHKSNTSLERGNPSHQERKNKMQFKNELDNRKYQKSIGDNLVDRSALTKYKDHGPRTESSLYARRSEFNSYAALNGTPERRKGNLKRMSQMETRQEYVNPSPISIRESSLQGVRKAKLASGDNNILEMNVQNKLRSMSVVPKSNMPRLVSMANHSRSRKSVMQPEVRSKTSLGPLRRNTAPIHARQ